MCWKSNNCEKNTEDFNIRILRRQLSPEKVLARLMSVPEQKVPTGGVRWECTSTSNPGVLCNDLGASWRKLERHDGVQWVGSWSPWVNYASTRGSLEGDHFCCHHSLTLAPHRSISQHIFGEQLPPLLPGASQGELRKFIGYTTASVCEVSLVFFLLHYPF